MEIRGIDVSAYNGVIDYKKAAESGVRIAILRITERGNITDPTFENNYRGFRENGVKVGVYKYSYALSEAEALEEARRVLDVLNGRALDFPVFYDMEWNRQRSLPRKTVTSIVRKFCGQIEAAGYLPGIYSNMDWYNNVLDVKALPYDYWLASYPYNDRGVIVESLRPPVGIGWQYSSKGQVPGITGYTDLNVFYKDYGVSEPDKEDYKIWVGECTGNGVNVRSGPGLSYEPIKGYPYLNKGNLVDIIGEKKASDGDLWYHVLIAKKHRGYVRSDYMRRAGK